MTAELRLAGAVLVLDDAALEQLVDQVADRLGDRACTEPWIRGADAAAAYLGCKPKRIYDLVSLGDLEHRKDGSRLLFRREWLDDVLKAGRA